MNWVATVALCVLALAQVWSLYLRADAASAALKALEQLRRELRRSAGE